MKIHRRTLPLWILWGLCAMLPVGLFLWSAASGANSIIFLSTAKSTQGTVLEYKRSMRTSTKTNRSGRRSSTTSTKTYAVYAAIVCFASEDGRKVTFTSSVEDETPEYPAGSTVGVLYLPGQTATARVDRFKAHWQTAILAGILAIGLGVFAAFGALIPWAVGRSLEKSGPAGDLQADGNLKVLSPPSS